MYLLKRLTANQERNWALGTVWQSKQEAEPGVALPSTFPYLADLAVYGYTTEEDLDGADARELREYAGLTSRQADTVIAAFAAL
jgi:hypothetical protein